MKIIVKSIFILFLGFCVACKNESSQSYNSTKDIEVPTKNEEDSIAASYKEQEKLLNAVTPEPMKKKKEEVRNEKKANSVFLGEGCCSNEPPPSLCCCEPVWIKYLEIYKSGNAKKIAKIRSEDPILNDCYKKIPSFKKKVDELEMSDEE
ncbi:MAG: hypothetical protein ABJB16_11405 [Saprospiraceae bacterium]